MKDERAEISLDGDSVEKLETVRVDTPRISERPMSSVHIERPIEHIRSPTKLNLYGSATKTQAN